MKEFDGFPAKSRFTPIPDLFFSTVLADIDDLVELKATLHIFWVLYRKRGYPRFITFRELLADPVLIKSIGGEEPPAERLQHSLGQAVRRGSLLHVSLERDGNVDDLYFVNTEADRRAVARIESGELKIGAVIRSEPCPATPEQPNIFALYERNIGLLTPLIAEELKEAEKLYPPTWVEDAFKEAVDLNKRSWRYIARILERWAVEGKDDGEPGRDSKTDVSYKEFIRRYGHLLKR